MSITKYLTQPITLYTDTDSDGKMCFLLLQKWCYENNISLKVVFPKCRTLVPASPNPIVLFKGFGDSSLDFELRVHLYNVDQRLSTISDINFAIDRAFREEGIEIPFPQRDLHVKTLPEGFSK